MQITGKKETTQIRAEISETENKKKKFYATVSQFFEQINKIDKPLARQMKKRDRRHR